MASQRLTSDGVADVLRSARRLLSDSERWCQGELAYDDTGQPVEPSGLRAVRWCAAGALEHAGLRLVIRLRWPITVVDRAEELLLRAATELSFEAGGIGDYNDTHSYWQVLALFDRAIAAAVALEE